VYPRKARTDAARGLLNWPVLYQSHPRRVCPATIRTFVSFALCEGTGGGGGRVE